MLLVQKNQESTSKSLVQITFLETKATNLELQIAKCLAKNSQFFFKKCTNNHDVHPQQPHPPNRMCDV